MNGDEDLREGMDNDYLWDRSGPVDTGVARLERLLRGYAHDGAAPRTAAVAAIARGRARSRRPRRRVRAAFAAVAVLALCAVGLQAWLQQRLQWQAAHPWQVAGQHGEVRIDGRVDGAVAALAPRQELATGPDAAVRLRVARIGEVALGPGSRLRLVETRTGRHRVQLLEGRLWARVWAPPGQFGVGIRNAEVLDLGCEFVLERAADGTGALRVRSGWVQVDDGRDEVLVPQGARVPLGRDGRPGIPRDAGAGAAFVAALDAIDAAGEGVDPQGGDIARLIAASRRQDAISVVSLVQRYPHLAQGPLFERAQALLPDAALVTRADIRLRGPAALAPWWDALPYPRMKRWWLQWPDAFGDRYGVKALWGSI